MDPAEAPRSRAEPIARGLRGSDYACRLLQAARWPASSTCRHTNDVAVVMTEGAMVIEPDNGLPMWQLVDFSPLKESSFHGSASSFYNLGKKYPLSEFGRALCHARELLWRV